jgi:Zn-finger nucleic acid-binding protein
MRFAIRFACTRCGVNLSIPIVRDIRIDALRVCPNCREPWTFLQSGSNLETLLGKFIEDFGALARVLGSDHFSGFKFTLELKEEKVPVEKP